MCIVQAPPHCFLYQLSLNSQSLVLFLYKREQYQRRGIRELVLKDQQQLVLKDQQQLVLKYTNKPLLQSQLACHYDQGQVSDYKRLHALQHLLVPQKNRNTSIQYTYCTYALQYSYMYVLQNNQQAQNLWKWTIHCIMTGHLVPT